MRGGSSIARVWQRNVVWRVNADGAIGTVAGTGEQGFSGDGGPATMARLAAPVTVAPLPDGGFLVGDLNSSRIRRVDPRGIIRTAAGRGPHVDELQTLWSGGYTVFDGGPATSAFISPMGVSALPDGSFLLADGDRIRLVADSTTKQPGLALGDPERDRADRSRLATAKTPGGRRTTQARYGAFGGRLLRGWAAQIAKQHADEHGAAIFAVRVPRCHRFSATRVDCETQAEWGTQPSPEPPACAGIDEMVLRGNGQVYRRSYACPTPLKPSTFKLRPPLWGNPPPGWSRDFRPADLRALAQRGSPSPLAG